MILADTSIWIAHFRSRSEEFAALVSDGQIVMHPLIIGELACGNLTSREKVFFHLRSLPPAKIATHAEALHTLEHHRLWGRGLGWVDISLLASAMLSGCNLWTLDKGLSLAARQLHCKHVPN